MDSGSISYERYLAGDDSALTDIISEYKDGLMLYINTFTHNLHAAEELMEEVFFKLVTKKPHFSKKSSFKTWIYTVGRNTALDYLRKNVKRQEYLIESHANTLHDEESVELIYLQEERKVLLHRCLNKLKAEYSQVLYLSYFEGFNNEQTAHIMKKSKRQTENLLYRAKSALKAELEKEGFTYEEL